VDIIELARDSGRIWGGDEAGSLKDDGGSVDMADGDVAGAAWAAASCETGSATGGACTCDGEGCSTTGLSASFTTGDKCSSEFISTCRDDCVLSPGAPWL